MDIFQLSLTLAAFLCSLVAGFLFAFAVVVMPGIRSLSNKDFLQAFQVIDRVIQNNQPLFMLVWVGSIVVMVPSAALGIMQLSGVDRLLLITAALTYLVGVQLPTFIINIPLNNLIQSLDLNSISETELQAAREQFELPWNRWNLIRTALASLVSILLLTLLLRI